MVKKVRAVAYPRYSSDSQREESISAQMRAIEAYCEQQGYVLVGSYPDEARSATTDNRPNFQKMIEDSGKDMFDVVVVHKLDRFARDRYDSAYYKRALKLNGVRLESVLERFDDSPESIILESVLEGMAEYYSKNLARESRKGLLENATKGLTTGGRPPYGYRVNPETKRLEVDERTAPAVRIFFEWIAEGRTKKEIATHLNSCGFRTYEGKKFTINSFDSWPSNRKYIGIYTWDVRRPRNLDGTRNNHKAKPLEEQIVIPGAIPAIIEKELFERVNELMSSRKFKPSYRKATAVYLLSDKVFCGVCGSRCNGNGYTNKGAQYRYYSCAAKCGNRSIRKHELERLVIQQLAGSYFTDESMKEVVKRIQRMYMEQRKSVKDDSEPLKRELADIKSKIDNWVEILGAGLSNKDLIVEKINEASARQEVIEDALHHIEIVRANDHLDETKIMAILEEKKHQLSSEDDELKKQVIQEFVDSVTMTYDDKTDEFSIALKVRVISGVESGT